MANTLKIKRGTRAQIDTAGVNQQLIQSEPYLITDEGRIAIGLTSATYAAFAKTTEVQPIDADLTAIADLTGTGILTRTGTNTWNLDTNVYLTGNQTITLSGDATGSGTTSIVVTLKDTGTAGTYTKITTDAKGRVISGTSLSPSDIPTLTAVKISDFDTQVRTSRLDQMSAPTASVSMNNQNLTGLADPVNAQDAATKNYVDSAVQGLDPKASARVATTENITLSGLQTIDGVLLVAGDRVLVKNQSTASQNGIYVASASAWDRSLDANTWNELISAYVFVEQGSVNGDNGYLVTVDAGGTLGVTDVTIVQFSGAGQITAGAGLTKTGNQLDVGGTAGRITVNADSIDISADYIGQSSITTLGTIISGVWQGTTLATTYGGTGLTTYAAGDMLYASATNTLAKLSKPSTQSILFMDANGTPSWSDTIDGGTF